MTDEEIKKLASAYAKLVCPSNDYPDMKSCETDRMIEYDYVLYVLQWLNRDYCIVSKEKVVESHKSHMAKMKKVSSAMAVNRAKAIALEQIFGKELFQETK